MTTKTEERKEPTIGDFLKKHFHRKYQSIWTACLGRNQSGKTDFMLFLMERLHKHGLADGFGSNIEGLEAPFEIDFIDDYQTLKAKCKMLNPNPEKHGLKRYFFLGDEMGDWAPKDQPWLNVKLIKELQLVRKYGLCMLACAIDGVDRRILNEKHFHGVFHKVSKSNPTIAVYEDWIRYRRIEIINIPKTKIKFNTFYSASFYMEPQVPKEFDVIMNEDHKLVQEYLEHGKSWKKLGMHSMKGKRAMDRVVEYHMRHCLKSLPTSKEGISEVEGSSTT